MQTNNKILLIVQCNSIFLILRAFTSVYPKAYLGFHLKKQKGDSHLFVAVNVIHYSILASLLQYDVFICSKCIALHLRTDAVFQKACSEEQAV